MIAWICLSAVLFAALIGAIRYLRATRDELRRISQRNKSVESVITGARCILWDAVVTRKSDGTYKWRSRILSPEARRLFGLGGEIGGDDSGVWSQRIAPADADRASRIAHEAIEKGTGGYEQEYSIFAADGSARHVREDVKISEQSPGIYNLIGVMVDITDLKKAQGELSRQHDLMTALMDSMTDQIYFKDTESRFLRINQQVAQTLGAPSVESAIGKSDHDYFPRELADAFNADDKNVMATGKPLIDRVERGTKDGAETWMSTSKAPIRDITGKVIGLVGISRDITDRQRVELELQRERDLLQALLESIPDQVFCKDRQSRFLKLNMPVCRNLKAESINDALGKTDFDFLTKEAAQYHYEEEQRIMATREPLIDHLQISKSNPEPQYFSITKCPIIDKDNNVIGLVGVSRDVTAFKRIEVMLQEIIAKSRCILWYAIVTDVDVDYSWDFTMFASDSIRKWLGLDDPSKTTGQVWGRCIVPEHMAEMRARSSNAFKNNLNGYEQEFRLRGTDQTERWVSENVEITRISEKKWRLTGIVSDINESKAAKEALAEERRLLRTLIDNIPDTIYCKDTEGRYVTDNLSHRQMLGATAQQEILGKTSYNFFPHKVAKGFQEDDDAVMKSGEVLLNRSERIVDQLGKIKWMSTTKVPLRNSKGQVVGLVGISRDITERKRLDDALMNEREALREREFMLRQVLDTNPNIIFVKDRDSNIILANEALAEFYQTALDQLVGSSQARLHVEKGGKPDELQRWLADDKQVIDSGVPKILLESCTRIDGKMRWYRMKKLPLTLASGKKCVLVVDEDVTDLKLAEDELAKERDLLQALMDNIPDNIYFKDIESKYIRINHFQAMHFGLNHARDATGKSDADFYPAERAQEFLEDEKLILRGQRIISKVERQSLIGKPEQWTLTSKVPFYGRDGRIIGLVGVSKDITEIKQMERDLAEANKQLSELARADSLTGLLNRRMLLELADNEWARWQRYQKPFSLMVIDADDFKNINDRYGHLTGDQALKQIATKLTQSIRSVDIVGRYGGEEFVVILPETTLEGATAAGEKILSNIRKASLIMSGHAIQLTVSIGIAMVTRDDKNIDAMLNRADTALYNAKHNGKDQLSAAQA